MGTKDEIIKTARQLFLIKGYDKTSIQNIIDGTDIAKGTFYHYFKSKEDLLNQYSEIEVKALYSIAEEIGNSDLNPIEKFETLFKKSSSWKSENVKSMKTLFKVMMSKENLYLRDAMLQNQRKQLAPIFSKIINEGRAQGNFNIIDCDFTAILIIDIFSGLTNKVATYLSAPEYNPEILNAFKDLMFNIQDTISRILGLKNKTLEIVDKDKLEMLIKGLMEN